MKMLITILTLFLAQNTFAQKLDTIWYNNKWKKTQQVSERHFFRVIEKLDTDKYKVKDYFETGSQQMEGFFSSLDPDIKNGDFKYWFKSGKKQMEITYEANQAIQVCEYNEEGEITKEWERIPVIKVVNGETVTEFRLLQRSPKFPGGTEALNEFIAKNIKYPKKGSNIKGQVVVQFKVNIEGEAINPTIVISLTPDYDREAINLIKKMPTWEPGRQGGKLVPITLSLPINFN
ncbi:energy transducer TonB [Pedobacter foliorum]|uniref:energy transducer TonB n=1 Tax=Pedobacter foliorum TaxID=2739058 RepID=UPI001564DCB4|nr:energy transducer TonB [Pedobacter foliorum]NRF39293.1 energy transducer TonB [Pedobacter foliorum]